MNRRGPGFAVLYRWKLRPGSEASFAEAWSRVSELLFTQGGSLGSRLHRGSDGLWYSYAQWPSAEARSKAFAAGPVDPEALKQMRAAIVEELPEVILESQADFMVVPDDPGTSSVGRHEQHSPLLHLKGSSP
jgi:heme-degrading monooxygenase HmoA